MSALTHLNHKGEAHMLDISDKAVSHRTAKAYAELRCSKELVQLFDSGGLAKGDALCCARIAAIQAAKKTSELIPLCHPLPLCKVELEFELRPAEGLVQLWASCKVTGQTGVEIEALTAVSIAALTLHDMGKAIDPAMVIGEIRLLEKTGGASGHWLADARTETSLW